MNTTDILKMFSNPDGWNEFQREPFLYQMSDGKMVAVATDSHRLCIFKEYDLHGVSLKEFNKPNVEKVIIPDQCTCTLSVERLQKALAQVPTYKYQMCEDCCGIKINGKCFQPQHLKPIADALAAMQIAEVPYIFPDKQLKIETEQFVMVVMCCEYCF